MGGNDRAECEWGGLLMSNYLVDGADLTSVADAIRAKSGGSSQLAFPAGFVSEIQAIPSGGGGATLADLFTVIGTFNIARSTFAQKDTVLDFGTLNVSNFIATRVTSTENDASLEIKCGVLTFGNTAFADNSGSSELRTLILSCSNNPELTSEWGRATKLQRILGKPVSFTGFGTGNYKKINGTNLTEFYVVPNVITSGDAGMNTGVLIDASLVSVANALKGGLATPQTLTISNATTKAKCNTIVGTVSQVTEGGETYDFFTQDASGTVTLADFITNTKGWTLA